MKIKTCAWGLAIVAMMAAALSSAFAPRLSARAQQDNKQDQKKSQQQKQQPQKPQKPEQEEPTIKFGTKLVNVLFSVQDKQNHYLNDLKQEDVQILENGQPQDIFTFKRELDLPLTMAILVDTSGSEEYMLPQLKDSGGRFVDSVVRTGKDTVAVIKLEGEARPQSSRGYRIHRGASGQHIRRRDSADQRRVAAGRDFALRFHHRHLRRHAGQRAGPQDDHSSHRR